MEALNQKWTNQCMNNTYSGVRNALLLLGISSVSIQLLSLLIYESPLHLKVFFMTSTLIFIVLMLSIFLIEKYSLIPKNIIGILICELINLPCYIIGLSLNPDHNAPMIISTCLTTICFQIKFLKSTFLILLTQLKLILIWFIIPLLNGDIQWTCCLTPYICIVYILLAIQIFTSVNDKWLKHLLHTKLKIKDFKKQLTDLIRYLPEGIVVLGKDLKVAFFNDSCCKIFHNTDGDLLRSLLKNLIYVQDRRIYIAQESTSGLLFIDVIHYYESESTDQAVFGIVELDNNYLEWRGSKTQWNGELAVILTLHNVTAIIQLEISKAESRAKTLMLRTVSHEIRTPTNTIISLADMIIQKTVLTDVASLENLHMIKVSSKMLLALINDLLDFSKMIAGTLAIHKSKFEIRNLLNETFLLINSQICKRKLFTRLHIDPLIPIQVETDPNRLQQIILNLLSNAMKFTLVGEISMAALLTENNKLHIRVRDTGVGIPPVKQTELFTAFNTSHDLVLNPQGCGLGLYISNSLVKQLGGEKIHLDSIQNVGSTFYFEIDIGKEGIIQLVSSGEDSETDTPTERTNSLTPPFFAVKRILHKNLPQVLIVDDNNFNRSIMAVILQELDLQYDEASNGLEAIEKVKVTNCLQNCIRLVIMDCKMPIMDGFDATSALKKAYSENKISYLPTIIGYSALDDDEERAKCTACGMKEFLQKPATKQAFINIVKKYLV